MRLRLANLSIAYIFFSSVTVYDSGLHNELTAAGCRKFRAGDLLARAMRDVTRSDL